MLGRLVGFMIDGAANGARLLTGRLRRGGVDAIPPGSGAVVADGLGQAAAYRDEAGVLHAVSARCTHLGCIVEWNAADQVWDCPCHGSRFGTDGVVLEGPARAPLAPRGL